MKKIIKADSAPAAIGPYSQGIEIEAKKFLFLSGQIALDPKSGNLAGGDIKTQTKQVIENIKAVLNACRAELNNVIKTTVFLADMNDFKAMNEIYAEYFKENPPARSTVQVARLPRDARVEIEVIAAVD